MCTHTLNQPPACFLCRHRLEGRLGLRMQTPHLQPPPPPHPNSTSPPSSMHSDDRQKPASCPSDPFWPVQTPTRVTAIPGIRHKLSDKFSPCSLVRKKVVESSHLSRLAKDWPRGKGDRRASPQGGMAVQTNKLATSLLSCCTGTKLKPWGFPQRHTQALDQPHALCCCVYRIQTSSFRPDPSPASWKP